MEGYVEVGLIPPVPCVAAGGRPCHLQGSADGKRLVYGTVTGVVSRCLPDQLDLKSKVVETYAGTRSIIQVASVSPDGSVVAGGDNNGVLYIWIKGREGVQLKSYNLGMSYVRITDLSFSDDSRRLAVGGVDKYSRKLATCIVVDAGNAVGKIEGHTLGVNSISYRQKKPYLIATGGADGLVCIHAGPPFKLIQTSTGGHTGQVFCIRFSPDGEHLVSCGEDGKVISWVVDSGDIDHTTQLSSSRLLSLAWSTDSLRIAVVGTDHQIRILDVGSGEVLDEVSVGHDGEDIPVGVCWTRTDWICVVCESGRIWGYKTEGQLRFVPDQSFLWQGTNGGPTAIGMNPLSGRIAVGDALGTLLFLWTKESEPRAFNALRLPTSVTIRSAVLGKHLGAAITSDGTIRVFHLPNERIAQTAKLPTTTKITNHQSLLNASKGQSAFVRTVTRFTDGQKGTDEVALEAIGVTKEVEWVGTDCFKDAPIKAISLDNDNAVLCVCANGCLYAYPLASASDQFCLLWSTRTHGTVTAVSSSVDGTLVALAVVADSSYPLEKFGDERTELGATPYLIEMYEVDDFSTVDGFRFVCVYAFHSAEISCLSLNPSGTYLASTDTSRNIYVVEVETGTKIIANDWKYHRSKITALDWSPDGKKLASGAHDKDVYVWNLENPKSHIFIHDAHQGGVTCVQFIFNNVLMSAGADGTLVVYELSFRPPAAVSGRVAEQEEEEVGKEELPPEGAEQEAEGAEEAEEAEVEGLEEAEPQPEEPSDQTGKIAS